MDGNAQNSERTWAKGCLHFGQSFAAVSQEVLGFPVVDPHHPEQQVPRGPQRYRELRGVRKGVQGLGFLLKT